MRDLSSPAFCISRRSPLFNTGSRGRSTASLCRHPIKSTIRCKGFRCANSWWPRNRQSDCEAQSPTIDTLTPKSLRAVKRDCEVRQSSRYCTSSVCYFSAFNSIDAEAPESHADPGWSSGTAQSHCMGLDPGINTESQWLGPPSGTGHHSHVDVTFTHSVSSLFVLQGRYAMLVDHKRLRHAEEERHTCEQEPCQGTSQLGMHVP